MLGEHALATALIDIDIPAQPAATALRAFASQTDLQLLYEQDAVKTAMANRLVGQFEKKEALRLLLRGTGLEAVFSGDDAASIRPIRLARVMPSAKSHAEPATAPGPPEPASETAATVEEVQVTGSRIRRVAFDALQPMTVVSAREIEDRAVSSAADVIGLLPAFGTPGSSPVGRQSAIAVGQSFANFLGLGSQRTLTLVDGRRFVAANTPSVAAAAAPGLQVDLNTIPVALIERVEVIAVGGAPAYGADAVAGTINIVRKKDVEGFHGAVQSGYTERGGAATRRAAGLYGHPLGEDRGNVVLSLEHATQNGLRATDRAATAQALSFQAPADPASPFRQVLVPDSRVALVNFNGLALTAPAPIVKNDFRYAIRDAAGRPQQFAANGVLVPFDPGTPTGSAVFYSGGDGLDLTRTTSLLTDSERTLANVFLDYRLGESTRLNLEGWYADSTAIEVANQPGFNEASFRSRDETPNNVLQGPIPVRLDNPFLPQATRELITRNIDADGDGVADPTIDFDGDGRAETPGFWLAKGHYDLYGDNPSRSEQRLYRGVAGLEGIVELAGRSFDWELYYVHGAVHSRSANLTVLTPQFNRAIDAVADPLDGHIRCRDTSDPACVPLNLFGPDAASTAAADYVRRVARSRTQIEQRVSSLNLSGSPFSLAAGVVGFAAGIEHRREQSTFAPDALSLSGFASGVPLTAVRGSFNTTEIYAETAVPLLGPHQQVPGVHLLELEGAARYVDHSTAGGATTWTAGLRFAPGNGLRLRGNYTESIRAPAITELFLPASKALGLALDPCDRRFVSQGTQPARRAANCAAAGVTQPFSSTIVDATQLITVEGNRELKNEAAAAWTVGAVVTPGFAPGLKLSADWINIRLRDAIEPLDATRTLQSCYDSTDFPHTPACGRFVRDGSGQVVGLRASFLNAGIVNFAGLAASLAYELDRGVHGRWTLGAHYFHLDKLDVSVTGSDFNSSAGEISNSRHRATAHLGYRNGPLSASLHTQYIGAARFDRTDAPNTRDRSGVSAFWLFNGGVGYAFSDTLSLQLNVDNLFDEEPPHASMALALGEGALPTSATYFPGLLGRSYALGLQLSF